MGGGFCIRAVVDVFRRICRITPRLKRCLSSGPACSQPDEAGDVAEQQSHKFVGLKVGKEPLRAAVRKADNIGMERSV